MKVIYIILHMDVENNTYMKIYCERYQCWNLHTEWLYIGELIILETVEAKYMVSMDLKIHI